MPALTLAERACPFVLVKVYFFFFVVFSRCPLVSLRGDLACLFVFFCQSPFWLPFVGCFRSPTPAKRTHARGGTSTPHPVPPPPTNGVRINARPRELKKQQRSVGKAYHRRNFQRTPSLSLSLLAPDRSLVGWCRDLSSAQHASSPLPICVRLSFQLRARQHAETRTHTTCTRRSRVNNASFSGTQERDLERG